MNDIDELMSKPVLDLTPQDIDSIIAYHRRRRGMRIAGVKEKKPSVDLSAIMNLPVVTKVPAGFKRRV